MIHTLTSLKTFVESFVKDDTLNVNENPYNIKYDPTAKQYAISTICDDTKDLIANWNKQIDAYVKASNDNPTKQGLLLYVDTKLGMVNQ